MELNGLIEANRIRDDYKAKVVARAIETGVQPENLKEMPEDLKKELDEKLRVIDERYTVNGVHFLKCQFSKIIDDLRRGRRVEFEAFGPYLKDYLSNYMDENPDDFTKTDKIGLAIMEFLRKEVMPEAYPVSLFDEYNLGTRASDGLGKPLDRDNENPFYAKNKERGKLEIESGGYREKFKAFIERIFRQRGIVREGETEGPENDFILISETEKTKDAPALEAALKEKGLIEYGEGEEIWFQNKIDQCEDPRYLRINLRTKDGTWQCAALDASGFLHERNRKITHLVILPKENFEEQQDQVWEILHALGFQPENYHNIFFETNNPKVTPESTVETLREKIEVLK